MCDDDTPHKPDDLESAETLSEAPTVADIDALPPEGESGGALAPGQQFGNYEIIRLLGKGGMGEVYEAYDSQTERHVALKVLSERLAQEKDRKRFLREGRLAAQVSHPNSVFVFGTEEIEGTQVIAMELMPGGTLEDRVKEEGPLPVQEAADLILQLIAGLEAAEAQGVLHRDIKPSNCFLDSDGSVKVGDYGLSISTLATDQTELTATGSIIGTPAFASPEQLQGEELDVRSDIYALGATLYYLLTGEPPFRGPTMAALVAAVIKDAPELTRGDVPRALRAAVLQALEKQPPKRFTEYTDMRAALSPFSSSIAAPPSLGLRLVAGAVDLLLLTFIAAVIRLMLESSDLLGIGPGQSTKILADGLCISVGLAYFGLFEGLLGRSIGKLAFQLHVVRPTGGKPGISRATVRALIFLGFTQLPFAVIGPLSGTSVMYLMTTFSESGVPISAFLAYRPTSLTFVAWALAVMAFATARPHNAFAGVHELASGTRVQRRPKREEVGGHEARELQMSPAEAKRLGAYEITGRLGGTDAGELLVGFDPVLGRDVWLHVVAADSPPASAYRRSLGRATRPRWLGGERESERAWDAYEAINGRPLLALLDTPQPWSTVRVWMLELSRELRATADDPDDRLPPVTLDRVWSTQSGHVKVADFTLANGSRKGVPRAWTRPIPTDLAQAQELLHSLAVAALDGRVPESLQGVNRVPNRPVPLPAQRLLERLASRPFADGDSLNHAIKNAVSSRGDAVSSAYRVAHLASYFFFPAVVMSTLVFGLTASPQLSLSWSLVLASVAFILGFLPVAVLALLWSLLLGDGPVFRVTGVAIVDRRGRPASRPRAVARAAITWSPVLFSGVASFLSGAVGLDSRVDAGAQTGSYPDFANIPTEWQIALVSVASLALLALAGAIWSVKHPARGIQDRIAGTYLVPR